jgi:hypothetical protein
MNKREILLHVKKSDVLCEKDLISTHEGEEADTTYFPTDGAEFFFRTDTCASRSFPLLCKIKFYYHIHRNLLLVHTKANLIDGAAGEHILVVTLQNERTVFQAQCNCNRIWVITWSAFVMKQQQHVLSRGR